MNKAALKIFAKLQTMLAVQNAQVNANPKKYIEQAYEALGEARDCFDEIDRAISGDSVEVWRDEFASHLTLDDIHGQDLIKLNAVKAALKKYYSR